MGGQFSKKKKSDKVKYINGEPQLDFKPKLVLKCFPRRENGLLFRLESATAKKVCTWAFYNDTKDTDFKVHVLFNLGSEVEGLGDTEMSEEVVVVSKGPQPVAEVVVHAGETALFIKGKVLGFRCKFDAYRAGELERVKSKRWEEGNGGKDNNNNRSESHEPM